MRTGALNLAIKFRIDIIVIQNIHPDRLID